MASQRSLRLVALTLGIAVALGLFTLAASSPDMAHALTVVPATAFVAPDGTDVGSCPQDAPCGTIQYAIDHAAADGDTIYVAGGVYTGTGAAVISVTKSITLYGGWDGHPDGAPVRDPSAHLTLLDGERQRRVVFIGWFCVPTLDGFTIARGDGTGLTEECGFAKAGCGGGILIYTAWPTISNNIITDNVAASAASQFAVAYGGGIYAEGVGGAQIRSNRIISNAASTAGQGQGGGLYIYEYGDQSGLVVQSNEIISNCATTTNDGAWGGGIAGGGEGALIEGNQIEGNRTNALDAGYGAAIHGWFARPAYVGNLVRGNRGGQAVYLAFYAATFEGNQVLGNQTGEGIHLENGDMEDSVLTNNVVADSGAKALWVEAGASYPLTATLLHNTLAGDGGGYGLYVGSYVTLQMTNTIMAGFSCGITNTTPGDSTINADHTLFWGNDDDGIRGTNAVDGDPAFVDAAAGNYHLGAGSAAIDAGVYAGVTDDIDGDARPMGAGYDIGADEWQQYLTFLPLVLRN